MPHSLDSHETRSRLLGLDLLTIHPEVEAALDERRPVVALESTLVAHGLPYPENLEVARRLEEAVRENGAVPATIAVLDGRLRVGLEPTYLERLGRSEGIRKLSRRDLSIALALGQDGATTVASTMIAADLAGIQVFATGGIGGVHRGAAESFDISADLQELARTSVAVVCAGAKSILDLRLTLEVLETLGVPVFGYGTHRFPAFFVPDSGLPVDQRVESPEELARILQVKWSMGLGGGALVAQPIAEEAALEGQRAEDAIRQALTEAEERSIEGKELTPFLLDRIRHWTNGDSLRANVALVLANARLAARLAVALGDLSESP